jgi:hypothetical protein
VDGQPPVTQLVAEPLDHDGAVVGQVAGRLPLLAQVGQQVVDRPLVQPAGGEVRAGVVVATPGEAAQPGADGPAELDRAPG